MNSNVVRIVRIVCYYSVRSNCLNAETVEKRDSGFATNQIKREFSAESLTLSVALKLLR